MCFHNILEVRLLNNHFKSLITSELLANRAQKFGKHNIKELYDHESNVIRLMTYNVYSSCVHSRNLYRFNINSLHLRYCLYPSLLLKGYDGFNFEDHLYLLIADYFDNGYVNFIKYHIGL